MTTVVFALQKMYGYLKKKLSFPRETSNDQGATTKVSNFCPRMSPGESGDPVTPATFAVGNALQKGPRDT